MKEVRHTGLLLYTINTVLAFRCDDEPSKRGHPPLTLATFNSHKSKTTGFPDPRKRHGIFNKSENDDKKVVPLPANWEKNQNIHTVIQYPD